MAVEAADSGGGVFEEQRFVSQFSVILNTRSIT